MEADPCLQSISIPMDYDQFDPFDDVCMDAGLPCNDNDMFTSLDEAGLPSTRDVAIKESPQQENVAATEQAHDFQELSLTDLLLMSADTIESQNWQLASNLIARLEHLLSNLENEGSPFVRLAYLFTLGLRSRVTGNRPAPQVPASTADDMSVYQMVQELSPFLKFAHFTANQATLEAMEGNSKVHVIDFDVMDTVACTDGCSSHPSLGITAVVMDGKADTVHRTRRRLVKLAESIGLTLRFDQVELKDLEGLQVRKVLVIANCMVQESQTPSKILASARTFLAKLEGLLKMVVLVDEELMRSRKSSSIPFVGFFCVALNHFSLVTDSLASSFYGGYKIGIRLVEK